MRSWTIRVAAILAILLIPIVVAAEAEKTVFDFKGTDGTKPEGHLLLAWRAGTRRVARPPV